MYHKKDHLEWVENYGQFIEKLREYIDDDLTYIKVI
jgi:hypothetical protein